MAIYMHLQIANSRHERQGIMRRGGVAYGERVSGFARQGVMFADPDQLQTAADFNNAALMMLADVLNDKRPTRLKQVLAQYNKAAQEAVNGQMDLFTGDVKSRQEILKDVINFLNNGNKRDIEAAQRAAIEQRKASVQPNGPAEPSNQGGPGTNGNAEPARDGEGIQQNNNGRGEENTEYSPSKTDKKSGQVTSDPRTMSDAEKQKRGETLRNAPAVTVEVGQIKSTEEQSARKIAEKWWDNNVPEPLLYDTEVGTVEINRNSVQSSLAHRYSQSKLDAITSLPEGFENAVYLGSMPDGSRQEGVVDHYFAYPINYNGKRCYVFCRAMQDANKNRLYVHEVFMEDRIEMGDTLQTAASQPHGGISLYRDILANVLVSADKDIQNAENKQIKTGENADNAENLTNGGIGNTIQQQGKTAEAETSISTEDFKPQSQKARDYTAKIIKNLRSSGINVSLATQEEAQRVADNNKFSKENAEILRTNNGIVYGWCDKDGIHLTPEGFNPNTPVHEYTHGYMKMLEATDKPTYDAVVRQLKETDAWQEVLNDENYKHLADNEAKIASEVVSRLTGNESYKRANEKMTAKARRALMEFWDSVRRFFGADIQ